MIHRHDVNEDTTSSYHCYYGGLLRHIVRLNHVSFKKYIIFWTHNVLQQWLQLIFQEKLVVIITKSHFATDEKARTDDLRKT